MVRRLLSAAIVASALLQGVAHADSAIGDYSANQRVREELKLPRMTVPLPPGDWRVSAVDEFRNSDNITLFRITLANIENGKLASWVEFETNVDAAEQGWPYSPVCERKDLIYLEKRANYPHEQDCRWLSHIVFEATSTYTPKKGVNIRQFAQNNNVEMPPVALQEGIRLSDKANFLNVLYLTNPAVFGIAPEYRTTWANSKWHKDLYSRDPKRVEAVNALERELEQFYEAVRRRTYF